MQAGLLGRPPRLPSCRTSHPRAAHTLATVYHTIPDNGPSEHAATAARLEVDAVVGGLGDGGELVAGTGAPHEAAPAALRHAVVARRHQAAADLRTCDGSPTNAHCISAGATNVCSNARRHTCKLWGAGPTAAPTAARQATQDAVLGGNNAQLSSRCLPGSACPAGSPWQTSGSAHPPSSECPAYTGRPETHVLVAISGARCAPHWHESHGHESACIGPHGGAHGSHAAASWWQRPVATLQLRGSCPPARSPSARSWA